MNAGEHDLENAMTAFAQSAIGAGLSGEVAALIDEAGRLRHHPDEALALLRRARMLARRHPVPLIALYHFHFYGHQLVQAREVGQDALAMARATLGADFGNAPLDRDATRYNAAVRFYLFTLKGLAYLNMRLGELDAARTLLRELHRLDPADQVGGALLLHVLRRHEESDDADEDMATLSAHPARGWAGAQP